MSDRIIVKIGNLSVGFIYYHLFFVSGQPIAKKAKNEKAQWFDQDSDKSTKVYVTGLPDGKSESWGEEEFTKYMSKCGVVDIDVRTNKPKVKLYRDSEGNFKGM